MTGAPSARSAPLSVLLQRLRINLNYNGADETAGGINGDWAPKCDLGYDSD